MAKSEAPQTGVTYFFTVATNEGQPLLRDRLVREALRKALHDVRRESPFIIRAWVLLPDHLHCMWTLPHGDIDFAGRWAAIKARTTQIVREAQGGETLIWHPGHWEHFIRDQEDFRLHLDYVHWNPVFHKLVKRPADWPYSTVKRYIDRGTYPKEWVVPEGRFMMGHFGE